jgi:hypothetical protein
MSHSIIVIQDYNMHISVVLVLELLFNNSLNIKILTNDNTNYKI